MQRWQLKHMISIRQYPLLKIKIAKQIAINEINKCVLLMMNISF